MFSLFYECFMFAYIMAFLLATLIHCYAIITYKEGGCDESRSENERYYLGKW